LNGCSPTAAREIEHALMGIVAVEEKVSMFREME